MRKMQRVVEALGGDILPGLAELGREFRSWLRKSS